MQPLNTETSGNFLPRLAGFWGRSLPSTKSPESPRAAHIEGHPSTGTLPVHASEHFICSGGSGWVAKATTPELCAKSLNNFGWTGWSSSLCVGLQLGACMVLGEIQGKDKTRSVPSDGFKAAVCTVAGECMGRVYIQSVYPWTSGEFRKGLWERGSLEKQVGQGQGAVAVRVQIMWKGARRSC